jgi:hypothetical protein
VLFYAILGLAILAPESVYSGDIGVKYVQAQALAENRFTSLNIAYPGEFLDPRREFFPIRPPFVMVTEGETQAIFPPMSAVTQAIAVSLFGFRGLIALSIVAAAIVLLASCRLTPRGLVLPVIVSLGLGGPLWFYAVSGWEHAPAVALGTAAFAAAVTAWGGAGRSALIAGALAGAGAAVRDEVLLLVPGLLAAVWFRERTWRSIGAAIAGVSVPLLLAATIEVWWFDRPAAAHLRHAVHLVQSALRVTDAPNPDVPVLRPMTTRERYDTVVTYWLLGRGTDPQVAGFVTVLVVALIVRWRWRSSAGLLIWLLAIGATALTDVWEVLTAPKWLAGLIRVSPFVVCALLPLPPRDVREAGSAGGLASWFRPMVAITTISYLIIAFAGVDTSGGKSLGPRLLLPLLPLLTVAAVGTVAVYLKATSVVDRAVGWTGAALVAAAVAIHLGGTIPAYIQRNADDSSAILAAAASAERIVVADDMFTAQLLLPLYDRKIIFLADSQELGERLGALLTEHRLSGALLVSRHPEPAVLLPPLRVERTEQRGRMVIQYWQRR